jgi:hypothetical protein
VNLRGKRGGLLLVDGDGNFVAGFLTEDEVLAGVCGAQLGDASLRAFQSFCRFDPNGGSIIRNTKNIERRNHEKNPG